MQYKLPYNYVDYNDVWNYKQYGQYGQLVITFNLPTQWHSKEGEQVGTQASERSRSLGTHQHT